ncbi:MAG: hypothetical protein AAGK04_03855, partial [Planctomycetota bacterium]
RPTVKPERPVEVRPKPTPREAQAPIASDPTDPRWNDMAMANRYEVIAIEMRRRYGVRVRKWRTSMSGVAWQVTYRDGTVSRLIESPRPKGPMSVAVFLHEIGHHAIGLGAYKPRCLEEYHAWRFSLDQMRAWKLNVTPAVEARMHESLHWAIDKAARRGLKRLPEELVPYVEPPPPRPSRRAR